MSTFDFTFQQVRFDKEDWGTENENQYDLCHALLACACTGSRTLAESVTELSYCDKTDDFWMATWDLKNLKAGLQSVSQTNTLFWDKSAQ